MTSDSMLNPSDDRLIRRHLDGELSDVEFSAINDRLRTDAAFRHRYVQLADLETAMIDLLTSGQMNPQPVSDPPASRQLTMHVCLSAIAGLLVAAGTYFLISRSGDKTQPFGPVSKVVSSNESTSRNADSKSVSSANDRNDLPGSDSIKPADALLPAAVIVSVDEDFDGTEKVGQRLLPGSMKFGSGQVQIEFMSGATVSLSGPAELLIKSRKEATLMSGRATTHVSDRARGFVLNGPNAAVVDLGTEFQMSVSDDGITDVAVTEGEIELSLLGDDGNTLVSQRIDESGSVRLNRNTDELEMRAFEPGDSFPSVSSLPKTALVVSHEYVDAVLEDGPEIFWRFEDASLEFITDSSEAGTKGLIHRGAVPATLDVTGGNVEFQREQGIRYIRTDESIDGLGNGPLTFEFWMRPNDLQHSTCLAVYPDDANPGVNHLNVIEIVTDTFLIHEPGAMRFLVRSPPSVGPSHGVNAFTPSVCTPGQWQHVVAVWDESDIRLYFNGRQERQIDVRQPYISGKFHIILGQLKPFRNERQFAGAIDEVAVYRKVISAEDIKRHFELISNLNPNFVSQTPTTTPTAAESR